MSNLKAIFILFLSLLITFSLHSQTYDNPGGTISTCSGSFFDSGGDSTNYSNNEDITTTFCSTNSGELVTVNFTSFVTENTYDFLSIYDGANTSSSLLIGTYSGTLSPNSIISSGDCLTFQFISDDTVTKSGWEATLGCQIDPNLPCSGSTPICSSAIPDNCEDACTLILNTPNGCPSGGSISNVFCLSNVGATAETPYTGLSACEDGNDMPNPAADVWYSFIATSNQITININGLNNPSVGLYQGSACGNLLGKACDNGTGNLSLTAGLLSPDSLYFLQISGGNIADTSDFELIIISTWNCSDCLNLSNLTASPLPLNEEYQAGETVEFCYTIESWSTTASSWLHAVVPTFGNGWEAGSITPTSIPQSCDSNGSWDWYTSITGTNFNPSNPGTVGPGFAFDSASGGPLGGSLDGNPGNNYGDEGNPGVCTTGVTWTFCWTLTASDCASTNDDLNISIETYADGETGSWTSEGCNNDPVYTFFASLADCCTSPSDQTVEMTNPTTAFVSWTAVPDAISYQVKYRLKNTTAWSTSGTSISQRNIPNLSPKKYYQYKIRTQCADGSWSDFSDIGLFYTSACDTPTGVASIYLDNTRMRIRWDNNPDEIKAKVRYREVGTSTWLTQNSQEGNNYIYINNLTPNATYQYRVRSNCDGNDWSEYSASYFHDLNASAQKIAAESALETKVYPNPAKDILFVELDNDGTAKISITITDGLGKIIQTSTPIFNNELQQIDISRIPNGYYFISIQRENSVETLKFLKVE